VVNRRSRNRRRNGGSRVLEALQVLTPSGRPFRFAVELENNSSAAFVNAFLDALTAPPESPVNSRGQPAPL
jgi:hypothetical protein